MSAFAKIAVICAIIFAAQILKSDLPPFQWFLFSDKWYARHIEVKTYILNEQQCTDLFANHSMEPTQLLSSELAKFSKLYLVARVRNLGKKHAWGTLACSVPSIWNPVKVPTISIHDDFCTYLVCLEGFSVVHSHENFIPKITYEWDQLYTK